MFFQDGSDPSYRAIIVVITFDWHDGSIIARNVVHFEQLPFPFTHIKTDSSHYLLVEGDSESVHYGQPNGLILTNDGQIFRILVLGGDIQQCIVRRSRDIVVGYGDIGVFETGMTQGVVVFNENGKLKWANSRYDIVHSYATHDSGDRLWFSFYTEFKLTFTKLCCTSSKCTVLRGREGFLIHDDGKHAVFASPWYDEHAWYWVHRINQK